MIHPWPRRPIRGVLPLQPLDMTFVKAEQDGGQVKRWKSTKLNHWSNGSIFTRRYSLFGFASICVLQ